MPKLSNRRLIEACVSTIQDASLAAKHGADRLEISAALETDGVTPSLGMVREILAEVKIPTVVLLRIRSGDFVYSQPEIRAMLKDAEELISLGASAIAVGCLTAQNTIDVNAMQEFSKRIGGKHCVCHRAFDSCLNLDLATTQLIDAGFQRILTSGGASTAETGLGMLQQLEANYGHRIELLAAGGIHPKMLNAFWNQSGVKQVHGAFRSTSESGKPPRLDPHLLQQARQITDDLN